MGEMNIEHRNRTSNVEVKRARDSAAGGWGEGCRAVPPGVAWRRRDCSRAFQRPDHLSGSIPIAERRLRPDPERGNTPPINRRSATGTMGAPPFRGLKRHG